MEEGERNKKEGGKGKKKKWVETVYSRTKLPIHLNDVTFSGAAAAAAGPCD